jgi:copper oxidase (laccase) domain-containing protein
MEDAKGYLNLWETNKTLLVEIGIPENNIESAGICTHCNHNSFFSHRHQKRGTGRFGAGIIIKKV